MTYLNTRDTDPGGDKGKQNPANKGDSRGVHTVGTMFYIATFVCTVVVMATPPLS